MNEKNEATATATNPTMQRSTPNSVVQDDPSSHRSSKREGEKVPLSSSV